MAENKDLLVVTDMDDKVVVEFNCESKDEIVSLACILAQIIFDNSLLGECFDTAFNMLVSDSELQKTLKDNTIEITNASDIFKFKS